MTALVSETTIDSKACSIQMCVRGSRAVYCTTELSLSVDKLKKKKLGRNDVGVQRSMSMTCTFCQSVKTENTYTPARLEALFKSSQSSPFLPFVPFVPFVPSRIRSPSSSRASVVRNHPDVS